jgi:hypothetical protein
MKGLLPAKLSRVFAILCVLASMSFFAERTLAASPDPRMYGLWTVVDAEHIENIGMRVFFSPNGNFVMIDPITQMSFAGNWTVGRAGLLVEILGNSNWGKLWDADVSFQDDSHMVLNVGDSQFSRPHRVTLQRVRVVE